MTDENPNKRLPCRCGGQYIHMPCRGPEHGYLLHNAPTCADYDAIKTAGDVAAYVLANQTAAAQFCGRRAQPSSPACRKPMGHDGMHFDGRSEWLHI